MKCSFLLFAAALPLAAQTFEVASVKPHDLNLNPHATGPRFLPGGRFFSGGGTLTNLICLAWNIGPQSSRIIGAPPWAASNERGSFDIEAKASLDSLPPGTASNVRDARLKTMLQNLLVDRFKLKLHRETRDLPVYAVVVAKGGPKLEKASLQEKDCPGPETPGVACHTIMGGRGRGLHAAAVTLADVLVYVENWTDRPLIDKTGLQGLYNVQTRGWRDLQLGSDPPPGAKSEDGYDMADVPTLLTIFERLGLKLQAQTLPIDVFVIDHVERPTGN